MSGSSSNGVVRAPVEQVFVRLADIERYHEWMPAKGTILERTVTIEALQASFAR